MLARGQCETDVLGLLGNGKTVWWVSWGLLLSCEGGGTRYDDGLDVGPFQDIGTASARARVVRVTLDVGADGKALCRSQGPRVHGFQGQVFACLDGRLSWIRWESGDETCMLTRCSSLAKMPVCMRGWKLTQALDKWRRLGHHVPAPIIARPIVIVYPTTKRETKVNSSELNGVANCD